MKNAPFRPEKFDNLPEAPDKMLYKYGDKNVIRGNGEFGFGKTKKEKRQLTQVGLVAARKLFTELEDNYGIKTAGFAPVVGHYRDSDVGAIIVSRRIDGEHYKPSEKLEGDKAKAAKNLLGKLTTYLLDNHTKQVDFLTDVGSLEQYVYKPSSKEYILADTDPYFGQGYVEEGMMLSNISSWARQILEPNEFEQWHNYAVNAIKPVLVA